MHRFPFHHAVCSLFRRWYFGGHRFVPRLPHRTDVVPFHHVRFPVFFAVVVVPARFDEVVWMVVIHRRCLVRSRSFLFTCSVLTVMDLSSLQVKTERKFYKWCCDHHRRHRDGRTFCTGCACEYCYRLKFFCVSVFCNAGMWIVSIRSSSSSSNHKLPFCIRNLVVSFLRRRPGCCCCCSSFSLHLALPCLARLVVHRSCLALSRKCFFLFLPYVVPTTNHHCRRLVFFHGSCFCV